MKERPILFQGAMVRALLDGSKTQTRRAVKNPERFVGGVQNCLWCCPYGQPGDRLWVRETWARTRVAGADWVVYREGDNRSDYGGPWKPGIHMFRRDSRILLEVTEVRVERLQDISEDDALAEGIEPPEEMTTAAVEAMDVWPTGAERACFNALNQPAHQYRRLWDAINGPGSWAANPWVWAVTFRRLP